MHSVRQRTAIAYGGRLATCCQTGLAPTSRARSTVVSSSDSKMSGASVRPFEDMPGPGGPLFFGTYFKYKLGMVNVHKLFDTVKDWHRQYGDVFKEVCLGKTVVHVSDLESIRLVYGTEGRHPRIEPMAEPSLNYRRKRGLALGLGNSNGEEWYQLRSAAQKLMMRPKELVPFLPAADQVAQDFVSHLKSVRSNDSQEVPDFTTHLGRWTLESFGMHCFDKRLGYLEESGRKEAEQIVAASDRAFETMTQLFASIPLYQITGIVTPKWKRLFAAEDVLYDIFLQHFNTAVSQLKERGDSGTLEEGAFYFLRYLMSREELTFNDVAIVAFSLLMDPLPTVKPQFLFLLYLLATNPHAQDKLYQEICSVTPNPSSPLTFESVRRMHYFKACFKESVRLMPMINENKRFTGRDLVLGGYHVPADTLVFMNNFVLYRDPDIFPDPDIFMPERWLQETEEEKVNPFVVQPFSHGPRMCIGRRFAEQDMAVLMARLLQNFRLEWDHAPLGMKYLILNLPDCPVQFTLRDR